MNSNRLKLIMKIIVLYVFWDQSIYINIFYGKNVNDWMQVIYVYIRVYIYIYIYIYIHIHTYIHVVASKFSRNHFISEKYKRVQSCKLNLFCSPFMQLYFSVTVLQTCLEAILLKSFRLCCRILNYVSSITKALRPWNADFSRGNRYTLAGAMSGEYGRYFSVVTFFFCWEILDQDRPVCWSIVVKDKPTVGPPYFGAFPSDRVPKATRGVTAKQFHACSNSCKL